MQVAFINNQLRLGGAETVIEQLRGGLERRGHRTTLAVADGKSYPRGAGIEPMYPRILSRLYHSRLNGVIEKNFPRDEWTDRSFRRLASHPADVLHLHNFHGRYASVESLAFLAGRKPLVWTFHALCGVTGGCDHPCGCVRYQQACGECPQVGAWPVGPVDRTSEQLAAKLARISPLPLHIIAPSRYVADVVERSQVGRDWSVHRIPNGVDPGRFGFERKRDPGFRKRLGLAPDQMAVVVVIRDFRQRQKGFDLIREAMELAEGKRAQIVLVGENGDWAAAELGRAGWRNAVSTGYVTDRGRLAEYFEAADLFLFASPGETFPCVVLEAMSAGCCVVATPTGGVVEQVEDRRSGLLAGEISAEALADVLRRALEDPEPCRRLGLNARQRVVAEFSEDVMVERHLELYRAVASST